MRRKKYTLFNFCTGDFKGVEQYLNRQAAKGWKLDKVGVLLGRFIWAERDDLRWCVDLADPKREREEEEDYLGLCAEGGWDLAAKTNNMYLFCSRPGLRPAPVQTDPELERKNQIKVLPTRWSWSSFSLSVSVSHRWYDEQPDRGYPGSSYRRPWHRL